MNKNDAGKWISNLAIGSSLVVATGGGLAACVEDSDFSRDNAIINHNVYETYNDPNADKKLNKPVLTCRRI